METIEGEGLLPILCLDSLENGKGVRQRWKLGTEHPAGCGSQESALQSRVNPPCAALAATLAKLSSHPTL